RAAGDTRTPMWLSAGGSALTIPATYLLVTVAGLGIMGAAYAQVLVGVLFCAATLALLWRGIAGVRIAGGPWPLERGTMRSLASVSGYSAGESLLFSIGILALGFLAFRLGTEAYAAHQLVGQLESLSFLPCVGFSAAAAALVGQSLGMRDPRRAMRSGWAAAGMAILWTTAAGAILALFPRFFIGLFTNDQGVVTAGVGALVVIGFAQPAQAVNFTMGGALRGSGDTRFTMSTTIVNWFVVRLPLAVLFAFPLGLGLAGLWLAVLVDYCVRAVILARRFRLGLELLELALESVIGIGLRPDVPVARLRDRADELVQLQLGRLRIAVLGVLDEEHHQEGHDRGPGVDDELPGVRETEHRTRDRP